MRRNYRRDAPRRWFWAPEVQIERPFARWRMSVARRDASAGSKAREAGPQDGRGHGDPGGAVDPLGRPLAGNAVVGKHDHRPESQEALVERPAVGEPAGRQERLVAGVGTRTNQPNGCRDVERG